MLDIQTLGGRLIDNLEQVIVGKRDALELIVVGLLCEGHVLIEDVPGVGKTMLARSLARSLDCQFNRIQFTPDMLPSDITGVSIYNQKKGEFEFRPGPIIGQIILADEINRATPKTQAALLEAMEERQVTVDGITHALPRPFMVLATQNPIEYEGTFPLPEAQLDRFLFKVDVQLPGRDDEFLDSDEGKRFPNARRCVQRVACDHGLHDHRMMPADDNAPARWIADAHRHRLIEPGADERHHAGELRLRQTKPELVRSVAVPVTAAA